MDPNWLLLLPLLVWSGSAEILNGSDVTGEMMSRMVKLMDGMRQQLEQLEQKNNDLTFEMEEQVRKLEKAGNNAALPPKAVALVTRAVVVTSSKL